jgi:hypothetical protein
MLGVRKVGSKEVILSENVSGNVSRRGFLRGAGVTAVAGNLAAPLMGERDSGRIIRIGIVGGGFGASFQWHLHPNCKVTAACELREDRRQRLQKVYGCSRVYSDFHAFLKDHELDAVGVYTPPHLHVQMATEAMKAGKHVISAVPAGLTVEELERLLETVKSTGMKYMMAETSRYRPEIQSCVEWSEQGKFGTIFYAEAEYHHAGSIVYSYGYSFDCQSCQLRPGGQVNLEGKGVPTWSYGFPPLVYITHSSGMVVPVMRERLVEVVGVGWGDGHESLKDNYYKCPFWNGTAFFKTSGGHSARIGVAWHIADGGCERGSFYGDRMSYIMERPEKSPNTVIRQEEKPGSRYGIYQGDITIAAYEQPNHFEKLPETLRVHSGHGESHTFITHEFISSILEDRHPSVNVWEAIAYTMPGIVAEESAMRGGELLKIKDYGRAPGTA